MKDTDKVIDSLRAQQAFFQTESLLIILGPTASGKTRLAVSLAKELNGEIINADSRQVYKNMDIGTGKDIQEYGDIPYHLIDILNPGDRYNVSDFLSDFDEVFIDILSRGKKAIVCGGTGFYIQSLLEPQLYTQVPIDLSLRQELEKQEKENLVRILLEKTIPVDFNIDFSSRKRIIRAIEITIWLGRNPSVRLTPRVLYKAQVIGLDPDVERRRARITKRLAERLDGGMIEEVEQLHQQGVTFEDLEYYGLEYKYIAYYLQGKLTYEAFYKKLETEIHRYAKRQMTYFRKMERDGINIHWIKS